MTSLSVFLASYYLSNLSKLLCSSPARATSDLLWLFEETKHASAAGTFFSLPRIVFSHKSMAYFFLYFISLFKYAIIRKLFLPTLYKIWSLLLSKLYFSSKHLSSPAYIIFLYYLSSPLVHESKNFGCFVYCFVLCTLKNARHMTGPQ